MKKFATLILCLVALSLTGITAVALEFTCGVCTDNGVVKSVEPGELIEDLVGTATPTGDYGSYTIGPIYLWELYKLSGCGGSDCVPDDCISDGTQDLDLVDTYANDNPIIKMYAPSTPGCYMLVLTVTYQLKDEGSTVLKSCVDMTCYLICVADYTCITCSEIFCDEDCDDYWTEATTSCPGYDNVEGYDGLCYPYTPSDSGINVVWYVIDANTMFSGTNEELESYLTTATIMATIDNDCFDPDWCVVTGDPAVRTYESNTYQIIMAVWGPDEDGNPDTIDDVIVNWCPIGTIVMVDDPEASISEVTPT
ncbi:MAG TPA: hypothetical protein HA349_07525 [Methanotrichaceae archaeon]|nr:hypothetical protein [Methanotrichaceae archaeon]